MRPVRVFGVAFAILMALPAALSTARAAPVEDVFREFDMFGTWAVDCSQPASVANPHVVDVMQSPGVVTESHDLGPDFTGNRYSVVSAERASHERMAIEVIFQPGAANEQRQKLVLMIRKNSRRTMFNQPEGGDVRVKDGIALAHGIKTPVLKKCE
jgi:hypothetical protein